MIPDCYCLQLVRTWSRLSGAIDSAACKTVGLRSIIQKQEDSLVRHEV